MYIVVWIPEEKHFVNLFATFSLVTKTYLHGTVSVVKQTVVSPTEPEVTRARTKIF